MLTLVLKPHIERGGYHLDRFGGYLDGKRLVTSRQPRLDGARKLLEMGYGPDVLLTARHAGRSYDSWARATPIGELAELTVEENDRGLRRRRWRPFRAQDAVSSRDGASPARDRAA